MFAIACMALPSCTKEEASDSSISDAALSTMATSDGVLLKQSLTTGNHEQWNIKMNKVAALAYSEGRKEMPLNSMLIKEKHDATGAITGIDIMYRTSGDPNAPDGWLFESIDAHGQVLNSVNGKGMECKSCHTTGTRSVLH